MDPPQLFDPNIRDTLDIPFKTEKFRDWVCDYIIIFKDRNMLRVILTNVFPALIHMFQWKASYNIKYPPHFNACCEQIIECFTEFEDYECDYRHWLTKYLLGLEAKNKFPPNSTFSCERRRFEIPFLTESFQIWVRMSKYSAIRPFTNNKTILLLFYELD